MFGDSAGGVVASDMKSLPRFLGIGGAKCGTTSLHDILSGHPDVFLPEQKELAYFCTDDNFARGGDYYSAFFDGAGDRIIGEITPQYLYVPEAAERACALLGRDTKLIVMLRNPADRAFSHFQHMRFRGLEPLEFEAALDAEPERLASGVKTRRAHSYLDRGFYARQLRPWIECFGAENVFTIIFETDFRKERSDTLIRLQRFLGLTVHDLNAARHSNRSAVAGSRRINALLYGQLPKVGAVYRTLVPSRRARRRLLHWASHIGSRPAETLAPAVRQRLIDKHFCRDITELETMISRDLNHWKACERMHIRTSIS
jgi:hypothetical protein